MCLPTRRTKKTDSRAKNFAGESMELDAVPTKDPKRMVWENLEKHLDMCQVEMLRETEKGESACLRQLQTPF